MDWGRKCVVNFSAGKILLVSFDQSNNTGAIDVKRNISPDRFPQYKIFYGLSDMQIFVNFSGV